MKLNNDYGERNDSRMKITDEVDRIYNDYDKINGNWGEKKRPTCSPPHSPQLSLYDGMFGDREGGR